MAANSDKPRRSILAPLWAVARLQASYCILLLGSDVLVTWVTALVEMLVARQLWLALYADRTVYNGYTLEDTLVYVVLSMVITHLLRSDGVSFMHWQIRSGNVLFDLMYPLRYPLNLMVFELSSLAVTLFTVALPLLVVAVFILKVPLLVDPWRWLVFGVSFLLGCVIYLWIEIMAGLLGFWMTETSGLTAWMNILIALLSGAYLPLWIFPRAVEQVIALLPFRAIQYGPLAILVGWTGPQLYLREIAVQLTWVLLLGLAVEGLYRLALRTMNIQGG